MVKKIKIKMMIGAMVFLLQASFVIFVLVLIASPISFIMDSGKPMVTFRYKIQEQIEDYEKHNEKMEDYLEINVPTLHEPNVCILASLVQTKKFSEGYEEIELTDEDYDSILDVLYVKKKKEVEVKIGTKKVETGTDENGKTTYKTKNVYETRTGYVYYNANETEIIEGYKKDIITEEFDEETYETLYNEYKNYFITAEGQNYELREKNLGLPFMPPQVRVTSPYGWRIHPTEHVPQFHNGTDFGIVVGTPLLSPGDGVVTRTNVKGTMGANVKIKLDDGNIETIYMHCSKFLVKAGDKVKKGEVVALSGGMPDTWGAGRTSGPHLHYTIYKDGETIDPLLMY